MDKIAKMFFLLCLITVSCSKKINYDENINNIKLVIGKKISIDFNKEEIRLEHEGLIYKDTIVFTDNEKRQVISLFEKYDLGSKSGKFWYIDENSTTADLHDELLLTSNHKVKSNYYINEYHHVSNSLIENDEDKIVKIRNLLKMIIEKKRSYKKANDTLKVFVKRRPVLLM